MFSDSNLAFVQTTFTLLILVFLLVSIVFSPEEAVAGINGMHTHFLDLFFVYITNLGNGLILVPFVILLVFRNIYLSMALAVNGIIQGAIVSICKRVLFPGVLRPAQIIDQSLLHFVPGVEVHKVMSFPSGHTVTIFGLTVFLALCYRNKYVTLILAALAFTVAISRVYLLQHFFTDLAGGAIIGMVVGVLIFNGSEQINKPKWMNQRLRIGSKDTDPGLGSVR
ncbi:MAG TPA: phosphatase PAP2 family protein [Cyclobacteriaceae bacterium]|nr:phosphatase PAP2 family protein [Cyclobacteriaceae bacterium]